MEMKRKSSDRGSIPHDGIRSWSWKESRRLGPHRRQDRNIGTLGELGRN